MISRRALGTLVFSSAAMVGLSHVQRGFGEALTRMARIGLLSSERGKSWLIEDLRSVGYTEGKDILLEFHPFAPSESLPGSVKELIAWGVNVIVASGSQAVRAAQQATRTIPIVMTGSSDPVGSGFAVSLARPGGNVTGVSLFNPELSGKRLELLKEIAGSMPRIAVLWDPDDPPTLPALKETNEAARTLGIESRAFAVRRPEDFQGAFSDAVQSQATGVVILSAPVMSAHLGRIAEWALQNQLPAIFWQQEFPHAGGLMSYGPDIRESYRRAAGYVDKILKGAKPADLPIEQPTKFELVVNLKTAKALRLTVPQSLLLRADDVVE